MDSPLIQNLITFLLRRAVTLLGAGAQVSDDWYVQTGGLLAVAGNEAVQWWLSHRAAKRKAETTNQ